MEIVVTAAVSSDGFIADMKGDTQWVQDWELFEKMCKEFGCIVMGKNTYEEGGSVFKGCQHIILTSNTSRQHGEDVHFVTSVDQAIAKAEELGFSKLLVIGGSKTNESFIRSGKVKHLLLDVHPLILGQGKKLFGDFTEQVDLTITASAPHDNFIHIEYQVSHND